jgi:hypothetical protein
MQLAINTAAHRERHTLCPVRGRNGKLHAAAETALLAALERRGLIEYLGNRAVPVLSEAGLQAANAFFATMRELPE